MDGPPVSQTRQDSNRNRAKKPIGTYVPPAKRVKCEKFDVGSEEHQSFEWKESKKKITGLINRANDSNVTVIIKELFQHNLVRYKGLLVSALMRAQEASSSFTNVYAALAAVINSRIKTIGLLLINRLIIQYRIAFTSNNKPKLLATVKFIAHLTNQEVVHEVLAYELIEHLIRTPTLSSIEIVIAFIKECGAKLDQISSTCLHQVFKTLRELSHEHDLDTRTHDMIDLMHNIRRNRFEDFPAIKSSLDLLDEKDRVIHTIELGGPQKDDYHYELNYFKYDEKWSENEAKYEDFKKSLLNEEDESEYESDETEDDSSDEQSNKTDDDKNEDDKKGVIKEQKVSDETGRDIIEFRKMVYSTIRSSVRHEEVVHKLLKSNIEPEMYDELCQMIIDFCGQVGHYEAILGLVSSKLCQLRRREFAPKFEGLFKLFYDTVHRFEQNKIRNIAKFYAHLLVTESIDWSCLSCIKLRENATSSPGRCFVSFLFQELVSTLSLSTLIEYMKEPDKEIAFKDILPKDDEQDMRFAINFFTCCGLGKITEDLREELMSRQ